MKVIITGASGFVGKALCKRMVSNGWQVRGTIRSMEQATSFPAGVEVVQIKSIGVDTDWSDALTEVDTVVHLAARVHVMRETASEPLKEFRKTNIEGTARLAQQAAAAGVKRFVFMSTIGVNGDSTASKPYTEEDDPAPHNMYSVSKREAEDRLAGIGAETGMEIVMVRAPLVYGPGNPGNFRSLLRIVSKGIPLPLASVGNRKSFIYVGNLVDALVTCASHPAARGIYLVSDGEDVSTPELIRRVAAALGRPARLFPFPPSMMQLFGKLTGKSDAVERLVSSLTIDSSKIRRELEWKPPYTMEQGLKETGEWFIKGGFEL